MTKAIEIVKKVLRVLPALVSAVAEIETAVDAAHDLASPGGSKITPGELAGVITRSVAKVGEALLAVFAPAPQLPKA